jgi:hypothetical protein
MRALRASAPDIQVDPILHEKSVDEMFIFGCKKGSSG